MGCSPSCQRRSAVLFGCSPGRKRGADDDEGPRKRSTREEADAAPEERQPILQLGPLPGSMTALEVLAALSCDPTSRLCFASCRQPGGMVRDVLDSMLRPMLQPYRPRGTIDTSPGTTIGSGRFTTVIPSRFSNVNGLRHVDIDVAGTPLALVQRKDYGLTMDVPKTSNVALGVTLCCSTLWFRLAGDDNDNIERVLLDPAAAEWLCMRTTAPGRTMVIKRAGGDIDVPAAVMDIRHGTEEFVNGVVTAHRTVLRQMFLWRGQPRIAEVIAELEKLTVRVMDMAGTSLAAAAVGMVLLPASRTTPTSTLCIEDVLCDDDTLVYVVIDVCDTRSCVLLDMLHERIRIRWTNLHAHFTRFAISGALRPQLLMCNSDGTVMHIWDAADKQPRTYSWQQTAATVGKPLVQLVVLADGSILLNYGTVVEVRRSMRHPRPTVTPTQT
jgi:hypothetical protein